MDNPVDRSDSSAGRLPIWIAIATDEAYALGAAATLRSAVANLSPRWAAHLVVLDFGMSLETSNRLSSAAGKWEQVESVHLVDGKAALPADAPVIRRFSAACYGIFLIDKTPAADAEVVVFLDADLCVRDDLGKLATMDFGDRLASATLDAIVPTMGRGLPATFHRCGAEPDDPFFAAGLVLVRPRLWSSADIYRKAFRYVASNSASLKLPDQEALNFVLFERIATIPIRWQVQAHGHSAPPWLRWFDDPDPVSIPQPSLREAHVVHFVRTKPWRPGMELSLGYVRIQGEWIRALWSSGVMSGWKFARWQLSWLALEVRFQLGFALEKVRRRWRRQEPC